MRLDQVVRALKVPENDLPLPLPPMHLSIARHFEKIADDGALTPTPCKVFKQDILYFYYGGLFYRPSNQPTKDEFQLPIAFVFEPEILARVKCFYPFDTGALANGKYGGDWGEKLTRQQDRFRLEASCKGDLLVRSLVYHMYGTNVSYLRGNP